jgi:hypothetical protein
MAGAERINTDLVCYAWRLVEQSQGPLQETLLGRDTQQSHHRVSLR